MGMRSLRALVLVSLGACAAKPPRAEFPVTYQCDGFSIVRDGNGVKAPQVDNAAPVAWRDNAGEHFVSWPVAPTDRRATEVIIPSDPRQDAHYRSYDTTFGTSTSDWRLDATQVCTARGGYNDLLARYIRGESLEDLTRSLAFDDREQTRSLIQKAIVTLNRRYWHDR